MKWPESKAVRLVIGEWVRLATVAQTALLNSQLTVRTKQVKKGKRKKEKEKGKKEKKRKNKKAANLKF